MNMNKNLSVEQKKTQVRQGAKIKVIGAGGGGGNAVNYMIAKGVEGVDFAIANTDIQALNVSEAKEKIQLGNGLGAGAKPEVGRKAAEEAMAEIEEMLKDLDMLFITVGLGGGTGTGAAPVIAEAAKKLNILTVAVVTLPFTFEGKSRMKKALAGKAELSKHVDTMITIANDRLTGHVSSLGNEPDMEKAFEYSNSVLYQGVTGITNLITSPGFINTDFADVQTIMSIRGASLMGMGVGKGEDRIKEATERAMNNPLLGYGIDGAKGILLNITGSKSLKYNDFVLASQIINGYVHEDAEIIVGTALDNNVPEDTVYVTVVATGFEEELDEHGATHVIENKQYDTHEDAMVAAQNQINMIQEQVAVEQSNVIAQQQNQFQNVSQQIQMAGQAFNPNAMFNPFQQSALAQQQAEYNRMQQQMLQQQQLMAQMQQQMQQGNPAGIFDLSQQTQVADMQQVMDHQVGQEPMQQVAGQETNSSDANSLFKRLNLNLPDFMK